MKLDKRHETRYLAHLGLECPFCDSNELTMTKKPEVSGADPLIAFSQVDCEDCGKRWHEEWKLSGIFQTDKDIEWSKEP